MALVKALSDPYGNFMISPRPGDGVCEICFNLTGGYGRCYACAHQPQCLDAVAPISYSIAHEQLHHVLRGYKRLTGYPARRFAADLAAVLWRFLARHEACVAAAAHVDAFALVTTVPSSERRRDGRHPLREIVRTLAAPTRERYARLLLRSDSPAPGRAFHAEKFEAVRTLSGQAVLLIDDTWTTGASAQSAAYALKAAGAGSVAALVIGRHLNRGWGGNDARLHRLAAPFDWDACALCGAAPATVGEDRPSLPADHGRREGTEPVGQASVRP